MNSKFIYAITLLLGLSLFSFYAKAQNWQAYKGIWLNGYDNATQAPIPPTGYSALTYFADSLGTYVYDWDSLAWLRIPGAGGGGGGSGLTTASNMLSVNPAGNVISGGTATHNTFNHLGNFGIQWSSPTTKLALPPPSTNFPFTQSASFTVGDTTSSPTTNFAQLYLQNVPVDVPTARLTSGNGSNQANVTLVPNSGTMQAGTTNYVTVGATQSVLRHGNVQWALSGANQRADLSSFVGSSSGLRFSIGSTTESVIQTIPSGDNLRFTTNNGNLIFDNQVFLPQSPTVLDTAVWFLARRNSDGAIVRRQAAGGGGLATADNGLIVNPAGNVRIGTSAQPGEVLDDGAVFATDSLNVGVSHFWFMPDSVQIGNLTDLGEGPRPAYILMKDGLLSGHTSTSSFQLQPGGTNTMRLFWGTAPLFSFGSTLLRYGSSDLTTATRLFEVANGNLLQFTSRIGSFIALQTQDGATGTESTGDILIRTGSVTSGTGAVGDIEIRLGTQAGSGSGGTLQLDPNSGFLTIVNIPTSDPCGSAPSGTVWSDGGVLKVCP